MNALTKSLVITALPVTGLSIVATPTQAVRAGYNHVYGTDHGDRLRGTTAIIDDEPPVE